MKRLVRPVLVLALLTEAAACSDSPGALIDASDNPAAGIIVSNPSTAGGTAESSPSRSLASAATTMVYLSAPPESFPGAISAVFQNMSRRDFAPLTVALTEGGFDPVGVEAAAGDSISVTLLGNGLHMVFKTTVPSRRAPKVVRISPATGRTDVALNVQIVVVFSEPVDASGSIKSSIHLLLRDVDAVSGHVTVSADGLSAEFVPDAPLEPLTRYSLVVDAGIQDLDGDALGEASLVKFSTSSKTTDQPFHPVGSIAGFVLTEDERCIQGAQVRVVDGTRAGASFTQNDPYCDFWGYDADQGYSFNDLPLGVPVTLRATANGYKTVEIRADPANPFQYTTYIVMTRE